MTFWVNILVGRQELGRGLWSDSNDDDVISVGKIFDTLEQLKISSANKLLGIKSGLTLFNS